jgi:quercetin dioxygenase-like cupin family protein
MGTPKVIRLPLQFDDQQLLAELERIENQGWVRHFNTAYYTGDWEVLSLRSASGNSAEIYPDPTKTEYRDTPLLRDSPVFQEALAKFECQLLSVRLMRLAPQSSILEHRDHCLSFEDGEVRVHIPVRTSPLVEFYLDGERIPMQPGEAWYLDLNQKHKVNNHGTNDRVHLVVDCVVNDWLRNLAGVA